jgi:hypothetical protein
MYKIIFRTLFYHWLILSTGISIGFIVNAEWLGYKSVIIERSISNIFFPIEFTEDIEEKIKNQAAEKVFHELGEPKEFQILGQVVYYNDEFYWCKYAFRDNDDQLQFGETTTRIRWKTWEYNYGSEKEVIDTPEKILESNKKFNQWHLKIRQAIKDADEKEKRLLEQEIINNKVST